MWCYNIVVAEVEVEVNVGLVVRVLPMAMAARDEPSGLD